jgi:hypothetical protein
MKNTLYMKVARKNVTNPNMPSVRPSDVPSIANMEPSPLFHLTGKCPEPVKHLQMFSRSD